MDRSTSRQTFSKSTSPLEVPAWPHHDEDELEAAMFVLKSGKVNQWTGGEVQAFEEEFAEVMQTRHAVAVANGTLALEIALEAWDIGPGDEVVVPPRTFIATASAVLRVGAKPVFADVDPENGNLSAETIRERLSKKTRAVIPVHMEGWPCEMDPIMELAEEKDLRVLEDCAQAHGARYRGRPVGGLGHAAAFSFCQDKILSTGGEGGMVTTDDPEIEERVWSLKDHGKDRARTKAPASKPGFKWLHASVGTNARMTELQAAIGRVQLGKLPGWLRSRQANAQAIARELEGAPAIRLGKPPAHMEHAYYRYHFHLDLQRLQEGWTRDGLLARLKERGLFAHIGTCSEVYREDTFRAKDLDPPQRLPVAARLHETSLMLPVHHRIEPERAAAMAAALRGVVDEVSR